MSLLMCNTKWFSFMQLLDVLLQQSDCDSEEWNDENDRNSIVNFKPLCSEFESKNSYQVEQL